MCFIVCKSTIINLIVKVKNKAKNLPNNGEQNNEKSWPSITFSCNDVNKVKRNKSLQCNLNPWAQTASSTWKYLHRN